MLTRYYGLQAVGHANKVSFIVFDKSNVSCGSPRSMFDSLSLSRATGWMHFGAANVFMMQCEPNDDNNNNKNSNNNDRAKII